MTTKEIAKEIREYFKPLRKTNNLELSIRTEYNHISVNIMKFNEPLLKDLENLHQRTINQWCIKDNEKLTAAGKTLFGMIMQIINKYHYDRSDSMTDYFDTNFYIHLEVGRYDKDFQLTV